MMDVDSGGNGTSPAGGNILKTSWTLASGQWETRHKEVWKYGSGTFADKDEWKGLDQEGV